MHVNDDRYQKELNYLNASYTEVYTVNIINFNHLIIINNRLIEFNI